jgi:hypothetical protein
MPVKRPNSKQACSPLKISLCVIAFATLSAPSFLNLDSQRLEARPCKKTWFGRLGCAIDPTNPERNGGLVQPYVIKPIQKEAKAYARVTSCSAAGAVTFSTVSTLGATILSPVGSTTVGTVAGTSAYDRCYRVWWKK